MLLLILSKHVIVLDKDLDPVFTMKFGNIFGQAVDLACCKPDFERAGFLLVFNNAELPSNV